ncbi:prepilin-type N-terminal cleavage/methylation domain-containing protein, partial [Streptococcus suis]
MKERRFSRLLKSKIPAFTLLEWLVVLVILSGSLLIF